MEKKLPKYDEKIGGYVVTKDGNKTIVTNDGKKGGWLHGRKHYDENGNPIGGIKTVVSGINKQIEVESGEVIINAEASAKHWKELSRINQSAGNGVAIGPPSGASDEDPEEYKDGGKVIEFNANHVPNKWILNYAKNIKEKHPEIWKLGGNIFGNEAFNNLKRVSERGYWLDSEEWMYIKWRSYVARHRHDFRIEGVVAMLKWVDKVDKGWAYMKDLIEERIDKIKDKKEGKGWKHKMKNGGGVNDRKGNIKFMEWYVGWYKKISDKINITFSLPNTLLPFKEENVVILDLFEKIDQNIDAKPYLEKIVNKADEYGVTIYLEPMSRYKFSYYQKFGFELTANKNFMKRLPKSNTNEIGSEVMKSGGKTIAQTPAPKKERIYGSKVNKPESAASESKAKSIKLSDAVIESIKNKIKGTGISLATAKAVVRRGMGAYSSSHRPTIGGGQPNSRTAWGLARLNAFVYKSEHGHSKSGKYTQDDDLLRESGFKVEKYDEGGEVGYLLSDEQIDKLDKLELVKYLMKIDPLKPIFTRRFTTKNLREQAKKITAKKRENKFAKGGLIAPNGKPSNLTPEQYRLVRTPAFKKWFGDWENDPDNASKVVDENGEPLVVYHGTYVENPFYIFDFNKADLGFHFGTYEQAKNRSETKLFFQGRKSIVNSFFLNVKNLFETSDIGEWEYPQRYIDMFVSDGLINESDAKKNGFYRLIQREENKKIREYLLNKYGKFIGFVYNNEYEGKGKSFIVLNPNQIKLADGTNTTFDGSNPDIRYKEGGEVSDFSKVASSSSRFRPRETVVFDPPLIGLNGAKLISYTWAYEWTMLPNWEGEMVSKRISDWTQAEASAETGRGIVHQYTIQLPDNSYKTVSSESVPVLLGYVDRSQSKVFGNLATASKTLAKQELELSIIEAKLKEFEDAKSAVIAKGFPPMEVNFDDKIFVRLVMGDTSCVINENGSYDEERIRCVKEVFVRNRLKEMGFDPYYFEGARIKIYDLKNRIQRQKRKIEQLLKTQTMEEGGNIDKDGLIAPNGKPSNLTPEQYRLVRTPAFKKWFGDWENDPENASKVVDENGEPLVVYHGSRSEVKFAFSEFNVPQEGVYFSSDYKTATWFSDGFDYKLQFEEIELPSNINENSTLKDLEKYYKENIDTTAYVSLYNFDDGSVMYRLEAYNETSSTPLGKNLQDAQKRLYKEINYRLDDINNGMKRPFYRVFLNIRSPYKIDAKGKSFYETPFEDGNYSAVSVTSTIKSRGKNDGVIIENTIETTEINRKSNSYIVFNPNQIKLADGTNTTFDGSNPDIRYKEGGELAKGIKTEQEHRKTLEKIASGKLTVDQAIERTAKDHLKEDPRYYTKLMEMEAKMANGGGLDEPSYLLNTPTGEKSNLTYLQQVLVRTKAFKDWFGDWETAAKNYLMDNEENFKEHYKNVSKVLDMVTLEPRVVYHGTRSEEEFFMFDVSREKGVGRPYAYFAHNIEYSRNFTQYSQRGHTRSQGFLYHCFLNIRNPFMALGHQYEMRYRNAEDWMGVITGTIAWDKYQLVKKDEKTDNLEKAIKLQIGKYLDRVAEVNTVPFWNFMARDTDSDFKYFLVSYGYDGIFYTEELVSNFEPNNPAQYTKAVTVFSPTDIKLADGRNLDFNPMEADIRMEEGGEVSPKTSPSTMSKKEQLSRIMFPEKFAKGGEVNNDAKEEEKQIEQSPKSADRIFVDELIKKMKNGI